PLISVIVPAWNEEAGIIKTIQSVLDNGYKNTELIIINDGSTDNSDQVIKDYLREVKETKRNNVRRVGYLYKQNEGKGKALNTGIKMSKGDIILTMDADSALEAGALQKLVKYYLDDKIMAVVGNVEVINASTVVGLAQQMEYYFGFYNKRAHAILGAEYIFGGACASFRREVFKTIGLFDTLNKTEDIEMSMRTKFHGLRSTYAEDVVCYTEGAARVGDLISQRVRWKKGRLDTFRKYRSLFFSTEEKHNFFLSFFILPFSLLAEIQLLFEPIAIAIAIAYSLVTSEYLSLAIGLLFIMLVFIAVSFFHSSKPRPLLIFSFPFFWPLFYMLDWIEFLALHKSLKMIRQGKDVEWQRWDRKGIGNFLEGEKV
ncbi:MAG TPA: glycosyltransferase family 2 protein, partial [Candidatus Saccharimonadales bacterium]|nr:glycosyltransferase family 2 protein [Candidatus Saccharimonadales bacterium]